MRTNLGRVAGALGTAFFVVFGAWAFLAPRSFFERVATWEPYNEHFLHDAGSFQLGIGAALLFALFGARGSVVALGGAAVASVFHAISHMIDHGEGGRGSDPIALAVFALVLVAGLVAEARRAS